MANFTTRVELHAANEKTDYDKLHEEMKKEGFGRTVSKDSKNYYQLPTAEYSKVGDFKILDVLESAKIAAAKTGKKFSVLVTQSEIPREWFNLPAAG